MNDRFKFRTGFTVSYIDDNGDDRDIQLFIKGYFSVDCGGAGIVVHSSIIEEALNNTDLSLTEKKSVVKYLEANYCENDEYWLIDNLDFLEQCTGLGDMDKTPVFEGDILKNKNSDIMKYKVVWIDGRFVLKAYGGYGICDEMPLPTTLRDYLGIGNIHENAELVK